MKRIILIGATGHFGGRISRRIAGERDTELVVASRSREKAQSAVDELRQSRPGAAISAAALDHLSPQFSSDLKSLRPDIVIHTAGPYQGQGYQVARACINSRCHYIDLADGREFVQSFDELHEEAQRNDLLLVSGASTLPGLSSVVIDSLRGGFEAIDEVRISIAPAHQTPRGLGTIAAVLSYCGKPFNVLIDGKWKSKYGWQDMRMHRYPGLGTRLSGACDVPDLGLLPEYLDGVKTVSFHAALEAKWEQVALWTMGWMTRAGVIRNWESFVPAFQRLSNRLINCGSDIGGMQIALSGVTGEQERRSVQWNLTARQNHGPEIPCSPALILARKLAADKISARGAFPCLGMFSIADFAGEVSGFDINWSIHES